MKNYLSRSGTILKTRDLLMAVSGALPQQAAEPVLDWADEDFLKEQARLIVDSVCLKAGQVVGKHRNTTPTGSAAPVMPFHRNAPLKWRYDGGKPRIEVPPLPNSGLNLPQAHLFKLAEVE